MARISGLKVENKNLTCVAEHMYLVLSTNLVGYSAR